MEALKNAVILVTGASDGIGKCIALRLAKEGAAIALVGRSEERLQSVQKEAGKNARIYLCDVRSSEAEDAMVKAVLRDFGRISVLVNNAGIWHEPLPVEELSDDVIDAVIETNLTAVIRLTKRVLPTLKKQSEAAVINIVSMAGKTAHGGRSAYAPSKWGLRGFTEVLRDECKDSNVRVAGIYPSGTATELFRKAHDRRPLNLSEYSDPKDVGELAAFMLTRPKHFWIHDVNFEP